MYEMKQSNDSKLAINKRITDTRNKKRKTITVGLTTENQSVVAANITGFINEQHNQNEAVSSSRSPPMKGSNAGVNRHPVNTMNFPAQMGGQNANNKVDMSQISYDHFGNIIN